MNHSVSIKASTIYLFVVIIITLYLTIVFAFSIFTARTRAAKHLLQDKVFKEDEQDQVIF